MGCDAGLLTMKTMKKKTIYKFVMIYVDNRRDHLEKWEKRNILL